MLLKLLMIPALLSPGMSFYQATDIKKDLDAYVDSREDASVSGYTDRSVIYPQDAETKYLIDQQNNSIPDFSPDREVSSTGYSNKIQYTQSWGDDKFGAGIDPCLGRWTFSLLPCLGYCKWCFSGHCGACMF